LTAGGNDIVSSGAGNDSITTAAATGGTIVVDGGAGTDTLIFNNGVATTVGAMTGVEQLVLGADASTINTAATALIPSSAVSSSLAINQVGAGDQGFRLTVNMDTNSVNLTQPTFTAFTDAGGTTRGAITATGQGSSQFAVTGTSANDSITGNLTVPNFITGGAGADSITLNSSTTATNVVDRVIQAAVGNSGTFALQAANSISTTGFDVITGARAGDVIALALYTGTADPAAADSVLRSTVVTQLTSVATGGTTAGANQVNTIRGTYSSTANTFVGDAAGTSLLVVYDANATQATTALEAIVLVGLGANTIGVTAGTGGLLSIS